MVTPQEAENQIVTDYEVNDQRPNDANLLILAIETHQAAMARTPRLVAADGGVYSKNEAAAKAKGVKRVSNRSTKSTARRFEQRTRWVGLGVIADNLISMGNALARQANRPGP